MIRHAFFLVGPDRIFWVKLLMPEGAGPIVLDFTVHDEFGGASHLWN